MIQGQTGLEEPRVCSGPGMRQGTQVIKLDKMQNLARQH